MDVLRLPANLATMTKRLRDSVNPAVLAAALTRSPIELPDDQRRGAAGLTSEQVAAINSAGKAGFFLDFVPAPPKSK